MPELNQKGVVHFLVLLILLAGLVAGVYLVTSDNPLTLFSKASNPPIVFKGTDGKVLPNNSSGIPTTTSPIVKVELTSTLGTPVFASPSSTPRSTPSSNNPIKISASCSGSVLNISVSGDIPSPSDRSLGLWSTLTDEKTNQSMIYEYDANQGYPTIHIAANFPSTGAIRGTATTVIGDGRTYTVKVYAAPFTSTTPRLGLSVAQAGFSKICPSTSTGIQTLGTVTYKIAENVSDLDKTVIVYYYTGDPTTTNYKFKDQTPGIKFLWVEFKNVNGKTDRRSAQIELVSPTNPSPSPTNSTAIKTAVILFKFNDTNSEPYTVDYLRNIIFNDSNSVNNYYRENSFNKIYLTGNVFGWFTIPYSKTSDCHLMETWFNAAKSAAISTGVNLNNYNKYIYISSGDNTVSCFVGADRDGMMVDDQTIYIKSLAQGSVILAHEFGHTLGLKHANLLFCLKNTSGQDVCSSQEYGDGYDVMGTNAVRDSSGMHHLNAPHKIQTGWLTGSQIKDINTSGNYDLYALESPTNNTQTLKIHKANTNEDYYLEYRSATGFDSDLRSNIGGGTLIHTWDNNSKGPTNLINVSSGSVVLKDGMIYTGISGVSVKQISHTQDHSTLQITVDPSRGLQVSPSSVKVTVVAGGDPAKAFDMTSNSGNIDYHMVGYPTTFGPGINLNAGSGILVNGETRSVMISAVSYVNPGIYSGEMVIQDNSFRREIHIPVQIIVASKPRFIKITYPNGGQIFKKGDKVSIAWDYFDVNKCMLGYSFGLGSLNWISTNINPYSKSYLWTIDIGNTTKNSNVWLQMVCYKTGVGSVSTKTENPFTVVNR